MSEEGGKSSYTCFFFKANKQSSKNKSPSALIEMGKYKRKNKPEVEGVSEPKKIKVEDSNSVLKLPSSPYRPQKAKTFQKWILSSKTELRVGSIGNKTVLRVSTTPDLAENRPCPPDACRGNIEHCRIDVDSDGKNIISKTVFLNRFEVTTVAFYLETIINIVKNGDRSSCFVLSNESLKETETVTFLETKQTCVEICNELFTSDATGNRPIGSVKLSILELEELKKYISDIVNHMNKLDHTVSVLTEIILVRAGEILSKMLNSKHGYFHKTDVIDYDHQLATNFASVLTVFMRKGFSDSLIRSINADVMRKKLKTGWIDCYELMIRTLSQPNLLFDVKYIKNTI